MGIANIDVQVFKDGRVVDTAKERPIRVIRPDLVGVVYLGAVYPLHEGNWIDLSDRSYRKTECLKFLESGRPIPYVPSAPPRTAGHSVKLPAPPVSTPPGGDPEDRSKLATTARAGAVWTSGEIDVLLDSYFRMLAKQQTGVAFSKADENRIVQDRIGRSHASVEFKFCNASAALDEMGLPHVNGYLPRRNLQRELREAIARRVATSSNEERALSAVAGYAARSEPSGAGTSLTASGGRPHPMQDSQAHGQSTTGGMNEPAKQPGEPDGSHAPTSALEVLWRHSTGGSSVAASPVHTEAEIVGPPAAGLAEAIAWMRDRLQSPLSSSILFLVGGPGAGKSHSTSEVVAGLSVVDLLEDGLAHRRYSYQGPHRRVEVINDATIPESDPGSESTRSLSFDIQASMAAGTDLVVCVNRGVLVEEFAGRADRQDAPNNELGVQILRWLSGAPMPDTEGHDGLSEGSEHSFLRTARAELAARVVDIVAVYLDTCSLFEVRPEVAFEEDQDGWTVAGEDFRVTPLRERASVELASTPAGALATSLLARLAQELPAGPASQTDPVLANIQSLSSSKVLSGLLTMLRCSELMAGQSFTYRELWGAMSRAILGTAPLDSSIAQLNIARQGAPLEQGISEWERLRRLAALRWSESLFNSQPARSEKSSRDPVARLTFRADPARDALPGEFDPARWASGWVKPVTDAFTSASQESPLQQILDDLTDGHPFEHIVTDFDRALDHAYIDFVTAADQPDRGRQEAAAWYGAYLTRLFACSLGITAFRPVTAMWTEAWSFSPALPPDLEERLLTLVRPPLDPSGNDDASYLPLFESRAVPLVGRLQEPRLAIRTDQLEVRTRRVRRGLVVELHESGKLVATVELDFALTREALACTAGRLGMTDQSDTVGPRLERFRAARLRSANGDKIGRYAVVDRNGPFPISLERGAS